MKTFKINENSWHARLVKFFHTDLEMIDNFCDYWWKLMGTLFFILPCSVIAISFMIWALVVMPMILWYQMMTGTWDDFGAILGLTYWGLYSLTGIRFIIAMRQTRRYLEDRGFEQQPSIVGMKYKSFKEKFCPAVEFV